MATLLLQTPEGVTVRRELVGAGSRFAAGLIDLAALVVIFTGFVMLAALFANLDPTGSSGFVMGLLVGGWMLFFLAYYLGFSVFWNGQSPGKRVLGIRVASADGYPASTFQHVLRTVILLVDVLVLVPIPLGLILMGVSARHLRLGDMAAGTVVLRDDDQERVSEPWAGQSWDSLENRTLLLAPGMAGRLDTDDFEFLRDVVSRRGLAPDERRKLFVRTARHFARKLEVDSFDDARVFLRELYIYLRDARRRSA